MKTGTAFRTLATAALLAAAWLLPSSGAMAQEGTLARWSFDEGKGEVAGDGADGAANGRIVKAAWTEGKTGGALEFDDYSLKNYLRPDVGEATRVVIPHHDRLNPPGPFTLSAVIRPTRDPLYYGGIFEKGRGYGASVRLVLLRGLKVRGAVGSTHASVTGNAPLSLNEWHEVQLRYDGTNLILTIDGKEQGRAPLKSPPMESKAESIIGERFSGKIDEISLTTP